MIIGGKSLKEIAEMPLREMTKFMREHHDSRWGVPAHQKTTYTVKVEYSGEATVKVDATSDDDAIEKAEREIEDLIDTDMEIDINSSKILFNEVT